MSMLHANQRHGAGGARRSVAAIRAGWLVIALLALVLVACGDDSGSRQFANDPKTPQPTATEPPGGRTVTAPPVPTRPQASPEALVDRRGAPAFAYWLSDDDVLWSIDGAAPRAMATGVVAFAPSPDGREVAIVRLSRDGAETSYGIDVLRHDGKTTETFDTVLTVPANAASPAAGALAMRSPVSLSWSPQGNRLLLAHRSGVLTDVPFAGPPRTITTRSPLHHLVRANWSPRGDVIAVQMRDDHGNGSLALVDPATERARVNVIAPVGGSEDGAKSIEAFDWKPRGDGIVFIRANRSGDQPASGLVVSWDRAMNSIEIMATGVQAGPTGSVTWLSVAPDGKAVAYIVATPVGEQWSFSGLFVRSLIDGQLYRVPVDTDASVLAAWWLPNGLAWAAKIGDPVSADEVVFRYIDGVGARSTLGIVSLVPTATPATARPVASPAATPIGTPAVASPVASPAASPVLTTPAG